MHFVLKNIGATYRRLVDKVFSDQIGRNLEAYVDDMVIKSISTEDMLKDIQETFEKFWSINMKLNPKKCSFGVEECPFLGHLITKQDSKGRRSPPKNKEVHGNLANTHRPNKRRSSNDVPHSFDRENKRSLFAEREEGQLPIYFVSRVLQGAELNYPTLEKLILALVHATRRLRMYFQAHTIEILRGACRTPYQRGAYRGPGKEVNRQ
ncbi:reverse transcriptase domain-containing protein [Tanacetum coccineum]